MKFKSPRVPLLCATAILASSSLWSQQTPAAQTSAKTAWQPPDYDAISALPVPDTSSSNPFTSFDIIYFDAATHRMALSSRSSKAVALYEGDKAIGMTPQVFTGVGSDNPHSGPNGTVIAGNQLWAGDYPSLVRVFDLSKSVSSPPQIAVIDTGGSLRADEMDYDPDDKIVAVTNGDPNGNSYPPFVTLISTETLKIRNKRVFDGTHGTPDARQGGLGSVLYDPNIHKFLVSITYVGSDAGKSAVAVVNPKTADVEAVYDNIPNCQAAGMAKGPDNNVLVGCDPGFPAPDPTTFKAHTYVIDDHTGKTVADITQVGGEDEVWYNPHERRYYTASRDFFTNPNATEATPVLGVIDARTNRWMENVPTGPNSHAVAANPYNNHIYVPLKSPNTMCGKLSGCVGVLTQVYDHDGH